ncbi:MAG: hypothetical protein JKX98_04530 [Alcanivoracaceae bacterium]|nr:hypothetical protein [Alcanivoracaceae bacterium]
MKKILMLICATSIMAGCATTKSYDSNTPMKDKYGAISVSPEARKALKQEIANNEDETKVICDRVKKTGSNIPTVSCKTIAEHKADRKRSQEAFRNWNNSINTPKSSEASNAGF